MRKLTGRAVLLWLGGFFGVIVAANAGFVALSIASFHGEDRVRPYQQGLDYNAALQARARQRAEGWQAAMTLTDGARLRVTITHKDGAPVVGLTLAGQLRHPTDSAHDQPLRLTEAAPGRYEARLAQAKGWRDVVVRNDGGTPFEAERRLWLP